MKTKPKSKINVRLLRAIQRQIAKEPRQFIMSSWFKKDDSYPNCGTAACVAGWAIAVSRKKTPLQAAISLSPGFSASEYLSPQSVVRISPRAGRLLGLDQDQRDRLFIMDNWPRQFRFENWCTMPESRARLAISRIDHFIKTNGAE